MRRRGTLKTFANTTTASLLSFPTATTCAGQSACNAYKWVSLRTLPSCSLRPTNNASTTITLYYSPSSTNIRRSYATATPSVEASTENKAAPPPEAPPTENKTQIVEEKEDKAASTTQPSGPSFGTTFLNMLKEKGRQFGAGTRQLKANMCRSWYLYQKRNVLGYDSLTRRELRLFNQTKSDLTAFAPFSLLLLVLPEVLPFLVFFVPSSLPSVYKQLIPQERILKRQAADRARSARKIEKLLSQHVTLRQDFFHVVGTPTEPAVRSAFDIENIPGPLLKQVCSFMEIKTFARPKEYLRYLLNRRLDKLSGDDKLILSEGVGSLTPDELLDALHDRGIIYRHHKDSNNLDAPPFEEAQQLLKGWLRFETHPSCPPKLCSVLYAAGAIHPPKEHEVARK